MFEVKNSMFEVNSIVCKASRDEMEKFYIDQDALCISDRHIEPKHTKRFNTSGENKNICSLIIEL